MGRKLQGAGLYAPEAALQWLAHIWLGITHSAKRNTPGVTGDRLPTRQPVISSRRDPRQVAKRYDPHVFDPLSQLRRHPSSSMNVKLTALVIGIAAGALGVLARTGTSEGLRLQAASDDPYLDSDGDLLPDQLEWVTLSSPSSADSDGDGRDDFLEVVQHTATYQGTSTQPVDNEMRVLLSTATSGRSRDIWMHCLFRFASGRLDLDWFAPYITNGQVAVPMLSNRTCGRSKPYNTRE